MAATAITSVVVAPAQATIVVNATQPFTATGIHADGTSERLSGPGLVWTSASPAVATITSGGVATGLAVGTAAVTATYAGVVGTSHLDVRAMVPNGSLPTAIITAPADGATVTQPTAVTGTATDPEFVKYVLELAPVGETTFTTIASSTTPVSAGTLGTLDPTLLMNDLYTLRLTVYDAADNQMPAEIVVQVDREQKVGNFTVSFDDLTVPLSGIDVTVTRTYDSRDKGVGDFGIGWRLGVRDVRLRKAGGVVGANWVGTREGSGFNTVYCVSPGRNRTVALTMPGGEVLHFEAAVESIGGTPAPGRPNCTRLSPPTRLRITWRPAAHTFGALAAADLSSEVFFEASFPGGATLYNDEELTEVYDPHKFLTTLRDGTAFTVTDRSEVQRISDPMGNAITITSAGITHSAGPGVVFEPDAQGRIGAVIDPAGRRMTYAYDANGDLASRADRNGDVTRFAYDSRHNLLQIIDPLGRTGVRNEYDADGRLVKVIDADGHQVSLTHDLGADTEQVRDRRGNVSVFSYDSDGNVTAETNSESETTRHTYDGDGNELTTVDGLDRTTTRTFDGSRNLLTERTPLGHVTRFAYGPFDQVTKTVDPTGRTTVNAYDPATGNLLSTTMALTEAAADDPGVVDACRVTTRFTFDAAGNVRTQTDALGKVTTNGYDGAGRLTSTEDPTGAVTRYGYDSTGNRISQTDALNRVTLFEYDAENRLVRTVHPDDSFTRTVYDGAGRAVASIDELGRIIRNVYDAQGRQVRTDYPDGTSTATEYDANGNTVVAVDQAGRRTTTAYDGANRPVLVTHPDGSFTRTVYDDAGQVTEERDERDVLTVTDYDTDGRVTRVTRPLGQVVNSTYDGAGRKRTETDPNNNTTSFDYDCAGRLTTTTYPATDAQPVTTRLVAYDLMGRRVAETDQAAKTTRFAYDAVGRLNKVTDALNQDTTYTYDAVGNRKTQTDARGNTTRMDYDVRNRERVRTLPGNQATTTDHDAVGNVDSRLDANGRRTTFDYDDMNRLLAKVPDPVFGQPTVRFTYTATGQRATMVDAAGTTAYLYHPTRDWLVEKAGPQGTLTYSYEPTGDLKTMASGHAGGAAIVYERDALNRIASARDTAGPAGTTSYSYDATGNLKGVTLPNAVANVYTYDQLNRLKMLVATGPSGSVASYAYTVGLSGNRTGVTELSGRTVAYAYDDLYRLKQEAVSADPDGINGVVDYTYDPVGNRLRRDSTLPGVPSSVSTYDANDRMSGEDYDANGNTLRNADHTFTYDYEDRLTTADGGTIRFVYDGDGNKVAEITGGATTTFLVDDRNPTGYSQVIDELVGGMLSKTYAYGLDLISQREMPSRTTSWYGYDGHGSVRYLNMPAEVPTDRFSYDSFGVRTSAFGPTANHYGFGGERFNSLLSGYFLRARWYNAETGRFNSSDPLTGIHSDPESLHRYSYASGDPVNRRDPSGLFSLTEVISAVSIQSIVLSVAWSKVRHSGWRAVRTSGAEIGAFVIQHLLFTIPALRLRAAGLSVWASRPDDPAAIAIGTVLLESSVDMIYSGAEFRRLILSTHEDLEDEMKNLFEAAGTLFQLETLRQTLGILRLIPLQRAVSEELAHLLDPSPLRLSDAMYNAWRMRDWALLRIMANGIREIYKTIATYVLEAAME
ncbi:MAG: RHS repeat-associated core domain-containing protein [Acidimicrobiales bacterium]